jgi:putative membrane protein
MDNPALETASASVGELPARLSFLDARAKARAVAAVKAFEEKTSAELVVTVKKHVRSYPEAHLLCGTVAAFGALLFLLFYPMDFSTAFMPVDVLVAFAIGFGLSLALPPLQRLVVSKQKRRETVEQAAKAAFVDLGVSRTTGRTGVLLYMSVLDATVAIVADIGVTAEAREAAERARETLERAFVRLDVSSFARAVEGLGAAFAPTMERSADDVNELSDEVA